MVPGGSVRECAGCARPQAAQRELHCELCALRLPEGSAGSQPSAPGRTRRAGRAADICAVPTGKRRGQDRPDPQRAGRAAAVRLPRGQCWPAVPHARAAVVQGNGAAHSVYADLRGRSGAGPRAQAELQVSQSHPPAAGGLDHRTRHPRAAHQPGGFCSGAGAAGGAWRADSGSAPPGWPGLSGVVSAEARWS